MASITSVISFFVLLLITYSYSAPVVQEHSLTSPYYVFTTDKTAVQHGDSFNVQLMSDDESTSVPHIHKERTFVDSNEETTISSVTLSPRQVKESSSEEVTTPGDVTQSRRSFKESSSEEATTLGVTLSPRHVKESGSEEVTTPGDVTQSRRSFKESSSEEATTPGDVTQSRRSFKESSSEEATTLGVTLSPRHVKESSSEEVTTSGTALLSREFTEYSMPSSSPSDEWLLTTMETSSDFHRRAIKPLESQEEVEASTSFSPKRGLEMTKTSEPSSSANSFGKFTGLLHDDESNTSQHQQENWTEESTKPVSVSPDKITK